MKTKQKGEIVTLITVITFLLVGVSSLVSSIALKKPQTVNTKAAGIACPIGDENPDNGTGDICNSIDQCTRTGGCDPTCCKPGTVNNQGIECNQQNGICGSGYAWGTKAVQTQCTDGKLDANGQCNPACCNPDNGNSDCPGEYCGVPNGACKNGFSCGKTNKYARVCSGGSCAWTFCDGKNVKDNSICTSTTDESDPNFNPRSLLCDSDQQCQEQPLPTRVPNVNQCFNSSRQKESCPATYTECCGQGFARKVHKDCSQSNDSGCVYWCEDGQGGHTDCGDPQACNIATTQCSSRYYPTVAPTAKPEKCDGSCTNGACTNGNIQSTYQPYIDYCRTVSIEKGNKCCLLPTKEPTKAPVKPVTTSPKSNPAPPKTVPVNVACDRKNNPENCNTLGGMITTNGFSLSSNRYVYDIEVIPAYVSGAIYTTVVSNSTDREWEWNEANSKYQYSVKAILKLKNAAGFNVIEDKLSELRGGKNSDFTIDFSFNGPRVTVTSPPAAPPPPVVTIPPGSDASVVATGKCVGLSGTKIACPAKKSGAIEQYVSCNPAGENKPCTVICVDKTTQKRVECLPGIGYPEWSPGWFEGNKYQIVIINNNLKTITIKRYCTGIKGVFGSPSYNCKSADDIILSGQTKIYSDSISCSAGQSRVVNAQFVVEGDLVLGYTLDGGCDERLVYNIKN